jgi:hypothetical protein
MVSNTAHYIGQSQKRRRVNMVKIKFRFRDAMSNWEWRERQCQVSSLEECIRIYGLDAGDVDYEIISIEEV